MNERWQQKHARWSSGEADVQMRFLQKLRRLDADEWTILLATTLVNEQKKKR